MPPRTNNIQKEKDTDEEEILQAVVLADSFNSRFKPLTLHTPRCLLPICNVPLLEWTFESLALAGVDEIFVFCRAQADQIKDAIRQSKFSQPGSSVKIVPVVSLNAMSVGDAMRELDAKQLISSDFILITGDVVSNLRLDGIVREHKERRKKNRDAIMTMVVKEVGAFHRTRPIGDTALFVLDSVTSECVHYEPIIASPRKRGVLIPRTVLETHPDVEIRNDLIDCSIDICAVEVLLLFSENFDYQDLRKDFVHGVLTSDLLGKVIHCHVADSGYAARVRDTKTYAAVSKDIISRWTFPLVPGDNLPGDEQYEYRRGNRYIAKDGVVLSRTCTIGSDTMIGSSTRIHDNGRIEGSIIGQRCSIGPNTIIRNSFIWNDTYVEANCVIDDSIVGQNVNLLSGSHIARGCLIGEGTKLGPKANLGQFKRVSREKPDDDDDDDNDENDDTVQAANAEDSSTLNLGVDAIAYVWSDSAGAEVGDDVQSKSSIGRDDDVDDEDMEAWGNMRHLRLADDEPDPYLSDSDSTSAPPSSDSVPSMPGSPTSLLTSGEDIPSFSLSSSGSNFRSECILSLERALAEGHTVDDTSIELRTLRMATNVSMTEVREVVVEFVVGLVGGPPGSPEQKKTIGAVVSHWAGLLVNLVGSEKVDIIFILQKICCQHPEYVGVFSLFLISFYNGDVVDEQAIRTWHRDPRSKAIGDSQISQANSEACWKQGTAVVKWLDTAAEESDEESEGDESDEE